jgi:hypothetical protein
MAFLLGGLTAELATAITEGLIEVGIGDTTSALIAGSVASQASNTVGSAITQGLQEAAKQVLGTDEYTKKAQELEKLKSDSSFVYNLVMAENKNMPVKTNKRQEQQTNVPSTPNVPKVIGATVSSLVNSDQKNVSNYSMLGNILKNVKQDINQQQDQQTNKVKDRSTMLADLITQQSSFIANGGSVDKSIVDLVGSDQTKLSMVQKLSSYYADKVQDDTDEYKRIKAIYNGKGITPESVVMTETNSQYIFMQYDETGSLKTLVQDKKAKTLPAVYGVFGGPLSPNNRKPINVPDNYFLQHDENYQEGYFSKKADLILVSRLLQNRDKWPVEDVNILNSIVIYFQTVGKSLSYLKGSLSSDVATKVIEDDARDDIFPFLFDDTVMNVNDYKIQRYNFYKNLEDRIVDNHQNN